MAAAEGEVDTSVTLRTVMAAAEGEVDASVALRTVESSLSDPSGT